jgi:leucyl-tRNA synthetase
MRYEDNMIHTPSLDEYDHRTIEKYWQSVWQRTQLYEVELHATKNPFYNLMMFPYPSAEGLHVGNVYAFTGSDIYGRFMAMNGKDVFEPIGFDAFGIHSENFAIKKGIHPKALTAQNVERFRETQLKRIGARYDWSHEVQTTDPQYYKWTQWIFLQFFKAGLAVRKKGLVNWCPSCKTVLADEQVIDGSCERCETAVIQRELEQWFFTITDYAQRLLDNLDWLDWSENVKTAQRKWIGRSEGLEFHMQVEGYPETQISAFTTRPDTIFGMTYVVLAPEHPLVDRLTSDKQKATVKEYREVVRRKSELDRISQVREKTGVFIGAYAINPVNEERMPIWIADYVLMTYGTGAIMAVPAHDERDFEFAQTFGLPIRQVIVSAKEQNKICTPEELEVAYTEPGILVNSGPFTGLSSQEASRQIIDWFERNSFGTHSVLYRLRDWLISRQRYWGPPIPVIYCDTCGTVPVPEDQLPVLLPELEDWLPKGTGSSPLAQVPSFVNTTCPICKGSARRETDVSDNFLDSGWYFLRYPSARTADRPFDQQLTSKWLPGI